MLRPRRMTAPAAARPRRDWAAARRAGCPGRSPRSVRPTRGRTSGDRRSQANRYAWRVCSRSAARVGHRQVPDSTHREQEPAVESTHPRALIEYSPRMKYETRLIWVLTITFGFVFFDRNAASFLMPFIANDLHFNNTQVGLVASALSFTWAVAAFLGGAYSDRTGNRK